MSSLLKGKLLENGPHMRGNMFFSQQKGSDFFVNFSKRVVKKLPLCHTKGSTLASFPTKGGYF
jgi:hypothetical protein